MTLTIRFEIDANELFAQHPPRITNPNKRRVFEKAGSSHGGRLGVTRWAEIEPVARDGSALAIEAHADMFQYGPTAPGAIDWHLNFADPSLFFAYGGPMFAQDEIQVAEHPALAALRERLRTQGADSTVESGASTPVLVKGVERRVAIDTRGIYGRAFSSARPEQIDKAARVLDPPTISNIIAMAAPAGGRGKYRSLEIDRIVATAYTGFTAAKSESGEQRVVIHTGFWGCGAFGGNRILMPLLQLIAARWAGVDRLVFHAVDLPGMAAFDQARKYLVGLGDAPTTTRIAALGLEWGTSDGN